MIFGVKMLTDKQKINQLVDEVMYSEIGEKYRDRSNMAFAIGGGLIAGLGFMINPVAGIPAYAPLIAMPISMALIMQGIIKVGENLNKKYQDKLFDTAATIKLRDTYDTSNIEIASIVGERLKVIGGVAKISPKRI